MRSSSPGVVSRSSRGLGRHVGLAVPQPSRIVTPLTAGEPAVKLSNVPYGVRKSRSKKLPSPRGIRTELDRARPELRRDRVRVAGRADDLLRTRRATRARRAATRGCGGGRCCPSSRTGLRSPGTCSSRRCDRDPRPARRRSSRVRVAEAEVVADLVGHHLDADGAVDVRVARRGCSRRRRSRSRWFGADEHDVREARRLPPAAVAAFAADVVPCRQSQPVGACRSCTSRRPCRVNGHPDFDSSSKNALMLVLLPVKADCTADFVNGAEVCP